MGRNCLIFGRSNPPSVVPRHAILTFLLLGSVFGAVFLIGTPPYQGPDEPNHLYRAYAISTGQWEPKVDTQRRGSEVPASLVAMFAAFEGVRWRSTVQTEWRRVRHFKAVPLAPERTVFRDYPNTAVYPAPVYLPAAAGLWLARSLGCSTLATLYLARGVGLLVWLLLGGLCLWLLPLARWLFVALLLLPMSVFTHAVVSADTLTDSIAFVSIAYLLRLAYGHGALVGWWQLGVLLPLAVCLASAKLVYTPLLLLGLLVPGDRFVLPGGKLATALLLVVVTVGSIGFWSSRSDLVYLPRSDYAEGVGQELHLPQGADARAHRAMVINSPYRLVRATGNSVIDAADMYLPAYIGNFGWLDLPHREPVVAAAYLWLISIALLGGTGRVRLRWWHRFILAVAALLCYVLVVFSQLLSWEPVGSHTVGTIQGRYLTPFAPLAFLLLHRHASAWKYIPAVVVSGSLLLLSYSAYIVYLRYYVGWTPGSYFG